MSETSYLNHPSSEISVIEGTKNELIVFHSNNDKDSFLELLKLNNQNNGRTLVTVNSGENIEKFVDRFKNYDGKIFLCLTGDDDGNRSTQKILNEFQNKNIKDIRLLYGISENGNQNLEEYLKNKLQVQEKNTTLVEQKTIRNEDDGTQSEGISDTQHLGAELSQRNSGESNQRSKPKQNGNHFGGQAVDGNHAGNGLEDTIWKHLVGKPERGPVDGTQPQNAAKNEGAEHSLGGIVSGRNVSNRIAEIVKTSTQNNEALGVLISKYKGQKLTNEQVAEVVSAACFVSSDKQVKLKESLNITEDLKEICHQFKSGGTAKEGRGILDEYYTDSRIVDAVRNLIKDQFKNRQEISVLEPSVGTGNFLYAVKELGIKSNITAFEINETTAKIAKILHPESDIHLRSFETEFSDEKGNKKKFSEKYDLVIGNPPYGDHRGLYKGLGEEPKISKYEDYFVKRSLDSLKPNGVLAMVLPSGWLNRQTQLKNAEILDGFRLANGVFAGTQVGTDIIILRKNSQKISTDISNYFEKHPERILGETREKTNRFGRLENYVYGNLED
ncbi:MAG: N-6 DNA methylase, partial [Chryseobacterium sp.]|nr:N-6 DNA methylase [Chryseobacterium sp.]